MTQRPVVEEETIEAVNEKLQDVMAVEPENVGLDKKINVLLEEYQNVRNELRDARLQQNSNDQLR